jgi:hypothetical protein
MGPPSRKDYDVRMARPRRPLVRRRGVFTVNLVDRVVIGPRRVSSNNFATRQNQRNLFSQGTLQAAKTPTRECVGPEGRLSGEGASSLSTFSTES